MSASGEGETGAGNLERFIEDFALLTDAEWRRHHESEHGLFVAEGRKVIQRALDLGYEPRCILTQAKWRDEFLSQKELPLLIRSEVEISQMAGFHVHRGALASFARPAPVSLTHLAKLQRLLLVESVVDHENIGAIFRNAAALGADGVILTEGCADPLYRRSLKVSMGSALAIPFATVEQTEVAIEALRAAGHALVALTPSGNRNLQDWQATGSRYTLMLGSEGSGLQPTTLAAADHRVAIPMDKDTDSVNVATAAAIALWHLRASGIVPE